MVQVEIILSAAILDGLVTKIADLTSIGIKTWMSISSLQNCGMYLFMR